MVHLRCSKCGSNKGFIAETHNGKSLEIRNPIHTMQIKASVHVTCLYCHNHWEHVPVNLVNPYTQPELTSTTKY